MNEYRIVKYDHDSSDELAKAFILNFINEYLSEIKSSKDYTVEQVMYEISQYSVRIFIVYDGGHPFGIVACSARTFYYHQILRFIYLESEFQTTKVYNSVCDILIQTTGYKGLVIISQNPIAEEYTNSGFFQVDYKNPEKSLVYLRTLDLTDKANREKYVRKHINYMKNFKLLYSSFFYTVFLFVLSMIFTLIFVFNSSVHPFVKIPLIIISIGLFASIFVSRYLLKKYNTKGEVAFGFQYNMTYINLFEYKFKSKTKELFSSFIQAIIDAGV